MIDHEFDSKKTPETKHLHMHPAFTKIRGGVIVIFSRLIAEKPERKAGKMPAMRRTAVRSVIGIVRGDDGDARAGLRHAMNFCQDAENIVYFLDNMSRAYLFVVAITKRQDFFPVADHIGLPARAYIDT